MTAHLAKWFGKSLATLLLTLPVMLLGLLVVAIALPFRSVHSEKQPFSDPQYPAYGEQWQLIRLPQWALWWDNAYDGMLGDKRGFWNDYCHQNYGKPCAAFYSMWQWAAIRNKSNYFSRNIIGCDVSRCTITLLAGQAEVDEDHPGWHFLVAERDDGAQFHYLGFVFPWWFDHTKAVYGRFGWKIKMDHNGTSTDAREQDRFKGFVFRVSPYKAID